MVTTFGRAGIDENNTLKKQTDTRNADVGFIKPFAGNTVPDGYLYCDGSAVSRTTYSELFAAIGTLYGAGDGSTTFNVPDLRGYFIRGTGGNAAALGVQQGDAIRNITGAFDDVLYSGYIEALGPHAGGAFFTVTSEIGVRYGASGQIQIADTGDNIKIDVSRQVPTANENRPVNFSMKYCIGY